MSYQVLARKFRPGTFAGLVGQDHVVRALSHALDNDRLHHAYLFTGTRGVGKTTIARVLAKCLNCEQGVSSTPCGECSICREVNENRFMDLIEVDAASRTRVDDTRELLENAQYLPARGRYKVYLIDEVHMLSASSFNALLKTLEEPPEHVKFLLATTDPKKVPVTVLSRCLQFQLKNISAERMATYLAEVLGSEQVIFEPAALAAIAKAARGSMRDALSIADQAIGFGQGELSLEAVTGMLGLVGRDEVGALIDALASGDAETVLAVVAELADRSIDFETLLAELLALFHEMAVTHATTDSTGDVELPFAAETVQLLYQIGLMGYRDLSIAPDPQSGVEMTLLRMLTFAPNEDDRAVPPITKQESQESQESRNRHRDEQNKAEKQGESEEQQQKTSQTGQNTDTTATDQTATSPPIDGLEIAERASPPANQRPAALQERGSWHEWVSCLDLGGVARMIAENSVLADFSEDRIRLTLDQAHDTLLSDAQIQVIERALCDDLERPVTLVLETGVVDDETPALRRARIAAERQRDARALLETDETVRSLLAEFDGRLDDVRPVERPQQSGGVGK